MEEQVTILNVDDYRPSLYAHSRLLKQAGYRVVEATTGRDALRLVATERPRLVLLDVNLPDISGFDVCHRIKTDPASASTIVVHLSATSIETEHRVTGLTGGADAYLTEPVTPKELLAQVEALLRATSTAQRTAEAELSRLYEEARAANQAKDAFIAVTSHELRTPLNAMMGWLQVLKSGRLDESDARRALEIISRNTTAQMRLLEDLLDLSRVVSGRASITKTLTDFRSIVVASVDGMRPTAAEHGVALELRLADTAVVVYGDASRLQQVVSNLLSNSMKFTPSGGSVCVALSVNDGHAEVSVTDTGEGIEREFLPHVFERFSQAHEHPASTYAGLGIGLWVARYFVEAHGGSISATSDGKGKGATFVVSLPLAEGTA